MTHFLIWVLFDATHSRSGPRSKWPLSEVTHFFKVTQFRSSVVKSNFIDFSYRKKMPRNFVNALECLLKFELLYLIDTVRNFMFEILKSLDWGQIYCRTLIKTATVILPDSELNWPLEYRALKKFNNLNLLKLYYIFINIFIFLWLYFVFEW